VDDLRVGPISAYDPDRRPGLSGVVKRRREKRAEDLELEADEFITASESSAAETGEELVRDYYQPSGPTEESE
jgi:hypothetical protein